MEGTAEGWVAVGFSETRSMVGIIIYKDVESTTIYYAKQICSFSGYYFYK